MMTDVPFHIHGLNFQAQQPMRCSVEDGKIIEIVLQTTGSEPSIPQAFMLPGMIDHQVNGCQGISFVGETLSVEDVHQVTRYLWQQGVTSYFPTLTTESKECFRRNIAILSKAMDDPEWGASIPGIHLEGPYLSPEDGFRGAHPRQWICEPDWNEFQIWWELSEGRIVEVTIAPEIPGMIAFIERCVELGIVVAIGHSNATAQHIHDAVKAGARISTHLGNGCANLIHRHNNPLWPQLANPDLSASLIADGFHLTEDELKVFWKVKQPNKILLVSDITRLSGMPPGRYEDFGQEVIMREDGAIMMPEQEVLAGASLPLLHGLTHLMATVNGSLQEMYPLVSQIPAQIFGLTDRGELQPGKRADVIWLSQKGNSLTLLQTMVGGKIVFQDPDRVDRDIRPE